MKNRLSLMILVCVIAWGCEPPLEDAYDVFTIEKGNHYSNQRHPEMLQSRVLLFQAQFDQSAVYSPADGYADSKNKLLGFSDCNAAHHENSARFAWQYYNNRLEIYAYCYVDGTRVEGFLGTIEVGEIATYRLELTEDNYVFTFKNSRLEVPRKTKCNVGIYYMLWPYFGGSLPAPHAIRIAIKRL